MKTPTSYTGRLVMTAVAITGFTFASTLALAADPEAKATPAATAAAATPTPTATPQKAEAQSEQSKAVNPQVQSEVEKNAAEKRAQLLKDAQAAIDETQKALDALDQGKKDEALAALEKVTGKLDLIVARDPKLARAPVSVTTVVRDLYANPETVKVAVEEARTDLNAGKVQQARTLLGGLASEAELQVNNIPLATYPAAIKAVVPLIDAGKNQEAKTALQLALNTLVVEHYVTPLPPVRAKAMLDEAEKLAEKSGRSSDENKQLHDLVENARTQLQLGEALGYGTRDDYKPLYGQLDDIQIKTGDGKSGTGFFDKIKESLKGFKDRLF